MQISDIARRFARSGKFDQSFYKEWAKVIVYLVKKYGVFNESDYDLCRAIINYDHELLDILRKHHIGTDQFEIDNIITGYEWSVSEEQKANRAKIKGEFNV